MKSAILLEEFSRIGGGQSVTKAILSVMQDEFIFDIITDKSHVNLDRSLYNKILVTRYLYYDGINYAKLLSSIVKLTADIKQNKPYIDSHAISINNHPNIFLFDADINIVHEPFLSDNIIAGPFAKKIINELIRISGVYSLYSEALFILAGEYIKKKIENDCKLLKIKPRLMTMHYPVDYPTTIDFSRKKKYILTFGRINPDKNLETVMKIASRSSATFVIAGAVNSGSVEYFKELMRVRPNNVLIIPNPSEEKKKELFTEATVYLHTKPSESYGLSVAEAIGYGCVPVVPRRGGPWEDMIELGKYGFGYSSVEEASDLIENVVSEKISKFKYIYDSRHRFSLDSFSNAFLEVVHSLIT